MVMPESSENRTFTPSDTAMQGYGRAIRSLRTYIDSNSSPSHDLILMCSAVFFCFELLRGDRDAASKHVESGLRIIKHQQSHAKTNCANVSDLNDELLAMFARMDLEATLIDDSRMPVLRILPANDNGDYPTTLVELDQTLTVLLHTSFVFLVHSIPYKEVDIDQVPSTVINERNQLLRQFQDWECAAESFEQAVVTASSTHDLDSHHRKALATCRLHSTPPPTLGR